MRKYADRYLDLSPWSIGETEFHPDRSRVSESLFCTANEYMGVRGYFEEGYSGDRLVGSYVNGVFEDIHVSKSYKGISDRVCFMVNTVDWLYMRLNVDGETLDLAHSRYSDFQRVLDFRTGLLTRSFVWTTRSGKEITVKFERFLSMKYAELGYQRLTLTAAKKGTDVEFEAGLDFSQPHEIYEKNFWNCTVHNELPQGAGILGVSTGLGHRIYASFALKGAKLPNGRFSKTEKSVSRTLRLHLDADKALSVEKTSSIVATRNLGPQSSELEVDKSISVLSAPDFDTALEENRRYWDGVWAVADIEIDGDPENQQGIRYSIFQLEQTFRGKSKGANIGAKGLTGEAYNGNIFWDTEVYCFPYYLFKNTQAARALLDYRFDTLPEAMERAKILDCEGACFPVATIDGTESCTLWQHASLQLQPTTSVAYALRHYVNASGDTDYLYTHGVELLVQIARFLATRVQWSERKQAYGYYCVMGPDEFQMMVNHNAYTNFLGAQSLIYAAKTVEDFEKARPKEAARLLKSMGFKSQEVELWKKIASLMYMPYDQKTLLYEQHEGYFDLPHVDIKSIPPEEFPLYNHWTYDRIYRNDMIKQPDVLMFMFLYNKSFSVEQKMRNYEYYEPRCIHESSLSPSVHSILAAELGRDHEAYELFRFATRIDLDNYNRNTREGLHMTAIAAAWMNIVYGFGGFRSDAEKPYLYPTLPAIWNSFSFCLRYRGSLVKIEVDKSGASIRLVEGPAVQFSLFDSDVALSPQNPQVSVRRPAVRNQSPVEPALAQGAAR